jgi:hypothetical protein
MGQLCQVFELYIWIVISGLGGIGVKRGLDKSFAQVASGVRALRRLSERKITKSSACPERSRGVLQFPTWELLAPASRKNIDFVR